MIIDLVFIFIGCLMLYFGAEGVVRGGVNIAKHFNISPLIIGLTVIGFGTSLPELIVSISSALKGSSSLSVGNAIGSNIVNTGLLLGLISLIFPITAIYSNLRKDLWINIGITVIFILFAFDGLISAFEGFIMFLCLFYYIISCSENSDDINDLSDDHEILSNQKLVLFIAGGFFILSYGADVFVEGAVSIAKRFKISEAVIGVSLVALGTSLPELATSIMAAFKKQSEISIGNILGSNIFNILCVLGISSMIAPIEFPFHMVKREVYFLLFYGFFMIFISKSSQPIHRITSTILLIIYIYFIYLLF